jgi:hypothetical protein
VSDPFSPGGSVEVVVAVNPTLRAYRMIINGEVPGEARPLRDLSYQPLIAVGNIVFPTEGPGSTPWSYTLVDNVR